MGVGVDRVRVRVGGVFKTCVLQVKTKKKNHTKVFFNFLKFQFSGSFKGKLLVVFSLSYLHQMLLLLLLDV